MSDSDSDSDSESEESENQTELKQIFSSIKDTTTCLFRLTMAIRDPAPESQHRSAITIDKSHFEEWDVTHARSKFPESEDFLWQRSGHAISSRRQYLCYREEHHQKLAKNTDLIGMEAPRTQYTSNSTEATPLPLVARASSFDVFDGDDALSQTSYAPSEGATIRVPQLPKEAREQEHYECPLCFMIVSIHTKKSWKNHVYRDLHPYYCTFKDCATADRLYDSRHEWFKHELEAHRTSWQCVAGCDKILDSKSAFEKHVETNHAELASPAMLTALKRTAMRSAGLTTQASCPFCNETMSLKALQRHVGRHQEQLALFALPPNLDNTEDEDRD
ncbi:hypothetical protein CC80DRAFT_402833, partial [Byssothecium circinans]